MLREREIRALKLSTGVRFGLLIVMSPLVWLLSFSPFDRNATFALIGVYLIVLAVSVKAIRRGRHLTTVRLAGVSLDIIMVGALPIIWYTSLGGVEQPAGITLKTSVTLFAILFISLNTLAIRPLYPLLVSVGSLLVHGALLIAALGDQQTSFTSNYLLAYTTAEISSGSVATRFAILILVGALLTLLTMRARQMILEAAELQKTNVQLGRYFSPNLVSRLADNPALFRVGGERKELSFVFTDLEGFTSLVESTDPAVVVPLLNGYLDELIQVAFRHEGTVDKIVGDAVHVIFGAPVTQPDHAERAVNCALEMDEVAQSYRARLADKAKLGVTRIGVNSGLAIVGNFGGDALFDYTAHGDAINIAARLEGANKYLGIRICVSADTAGQIRDFGGRPIGKLWLKGKREGTEAFEPLAGNTSASPAIRDYLEAYRLLSSNSSNAREQFEILCRQHPDDALARFHLERLMAGQTGTDIMLEGK